MEKFKQLGLSYEILNVLENAGFKEPSEIQVKSIPLALAGKDIIGGSATGSGKTLVFASPIIDNLIPNKNVQALILTPTRELAEQVADSIRKFARNKKLKVLAIYGGISIESQIRKIPYTDVIVATPGRTLDHLKRRTLNLNQVKFLVLDEVDRMFDMGFYRDVEMILKQCPKERQTMLFSATISPDIDYLSKKYTRNAIEVSVNSYVDHSKLKQIYYDVESHMKFSLLVHLLNKAKTGNFCINSSGSQIKEKNNLVMIFCSTRRNVDLVADNLQKVGINSKAIHGGLSQNKRSRTLDEFHNEEVNVLVCTDVAARGLDIKGVSDIYNYDLPSEAKDYIHRIGRTARAGSEGKAINILSNRDYENFENIIRDKCLNITQEELPVFETIRLEIDAPRNRFRDNQRRNGNNQGGNRSNQRREGNNRGRSFGRGNNSRFRNTPRGINNNSGGRSHSRGNFGRGRRY
ncbi:MAG: DEAD/DEAH box helicase [Nanoarchaeota archaeon]|nr:DEAD/DEAH box helicase [Nanoarchaeota archaeon]